MEMWSVISAEYQDTKNKDNIVLIIHRYLHIAVFHLKKSKLSFTFDFIPCDILYYTFSSEQGCISLRFKWKSIESSVLTLNFFKGCENIYFILLFQFYSTILGHLVQVKQYHFNSVKDSVFFH